ncbi:hypothetical protein Pelo_7870 [Pelomyxa schiedti]|nr:hypothetical protein Pelo_7870 [Pelomyxa schiedti]
MANNHAPPAPQQRTDDDTNNTNIDRVLAVSRVVWDNVVSPGWLDGPRDSRGNIKCGTNGCRQWDLFRAAEAMFPIVGLVCRRVLAFDPRWGAYIGSYCAIATAASIPAPSCVAWILNNRHVRGRIGNDIRELSFPMDVAYVGRGAPDAKVVLAASPKRAGSQGGERDSDSRRVDAVDFGVVVKEVSATLAGLLMGGHVGLATSLFGDVNHPESIGCGTSTTNNTGCTLPRLWDGHRIVSWENACHTENGSDHPVNGGVAGLREKVIEHMRESGNLHLGQSVCSSGSVDGVRWLVGVLGVETKEAPWLLYEPIRSCLYDGNMEVVRWLFERFELGKHQTALSDLCNSCACGPHPGNVKCTVEDCQWPLVQDFLQENGETDILQDVRNPEVVKWLLTVLPTLPHDNAVLNRVCVSTGDVELAQWLVTEHNFRPTAATFASACSRGSTLARWLSTRVTLSQSDIIKSLVFALSWGNIEVAEWLNETFHVMQAVNSNTEVSENCLIQLCTESGDYRDSVVGLEWFLQHLSAPDHSGISMSCIHKAISQALNCVNSVALLLDTFPAVVRGIGQGDFKEIVIGF